jgi:hypothetical protein
LTIGVGIIIHFKNIYLSSISHHSKINLPTLPINQYSTKPAATANMVGWAWKMWAKQAAASRTGAVQAAHVWWGSGVLSK